MIRKNLGLSELQARTLRIFVIEDRKVIETTLYDHVMKSAPKHEGNIPSVSGYARIRDQYFPVDQTRDTNYYLYRGHAEDALLLIEMQAKDQ